MKKPLGLVAVSLAVTAAVVVACAGDLLARPAATRSRAESRIADRSTGRANSLRTTNGVATHTTRYTLAQLHRRNPVDWVGRAHNAGLDFMFAQMRHHVRFHDACLRMVARVADSLNTNGPRVPAEMVVPWVGKNCSLLTAKRADNAFQQASLMLAPAPIARARFKGYVVSDSAYALLSQIQGAADTIQNVTSFESVLGPILDAASTLSDDSSVVQAAVSVAEYSAEYWTTSGTIDSAYSAVSTDMFEGCHSGEYEGQSYTSDAGLVTCDGGEWLVSSPAAWNRTSSPAVMHFASFQRTGAGVMHFASSRGSWCTAANSNWGLAVGVIGGDVGGGIIGGLGGFFLGGGATAGAGAVVVGVSSSAAVAVGWLGFRFICRII